MVRTRYCHNCFLELDTDPEYKVLKKRLDRESARVWQPSPAVMKSLRAIRKYEDAYYKNCRHPRDPDEEDIEEDEEGMSEEDAEYHVCDDQCWDEDCFGDFCEDMSDWENADGKEEDAQKDEGQGSEKGNDEVDDSGEPSDGHTNPGVSHKAGLGTQSGSPNRAITIRNKVD
jgi:hypothetical protein